MSYLRNRPFMVINFRYVLADGQKSNSPGFAEAATWEPIENMTIVDRISNKIMQEAELILDLFENKVVKCRDSEINKVEIFDIMVARHSIDIKEALTSWIKKDSSNLDKVKEFIARLGAKDSEKEETDVSDGRDD